MASTLKINASRINADLMHSCQWGSTPDGGMNRLTLNDDDKKVREWFVSEVQKYGCTVKIDCIGNIFATRPGLNNSLAPVGIGSHLDTQPAGGKYDGIVGVHSALEVLKTLHDNNFTTYAPIAVVDWTNEEGARFPPAMLGSGVWAGAIEQEYAYSIPDITSPSTTFHSELARIGFVGDTPASYTAIPLSAHFEVHIEQGPMLQEEDKPIGVVTGVQAISWHTLTLTGAPAHTGTTPFPSRSDALLAAAELIVHTHTTALSIPGSLATVAVIHSSTDSSSSAQSVNTIAGQVELKVDARALDDATLAVLEEKLEERWMGREKRGKGVSVKAERFWSAKKTTFDEVCVQCVRSSVEEVGVPWREILSGAGHDSVHTALRCPTSMIFIRCKDGISHNPAEYSSAEDIATGAQVLLGAVLRYDQHLRVLNEGKTA